jgi:hypothetical protein
MITVTVYIRSLPSSPFLRFGFTGPPLSADDEAVKERARVARSGRKLKSQ